MEEQRVKELEEALWGSVMDTIEGSGVTMEEVVRAWIGVGERLGRRAVTVAGWRQMVERLEAVGVSVPEVMGVPEAVSGEGDGRGSD